MFSLVRKWASHLIHKHGQKFVKEVPEELLQFSLSSCSVELPRLDLQEKVLENLDVLLPFQVNEAYLEDVAVSLRWRGSSCTIVVEARLLVFKGKMRSFQDWAGLLRELAPELQSKEAAQSFKAAALKAHEDEVLDFARRMLGTAVADQTGSLPDIEFKLGGDPSSRDGDWGFQLVLEEDSGSISLTGSGFEICDGVNLNEILNNSQAFRLDFRLRDLTATCQVEGRCSPCIGPCDELTLEFTFAQSRKVKSRVDLPKWPKRSMSQAFEEMDELPTVSLAVTSTSCPVRASIAQVAFFTSHGLSWGRWFAYREALGVELCLEDSIVDQLDVSLETPPLCTDSDVPSVYAVMPQGSASSAGTAGSRYQHKWLLQLPPLLDASSVSKTTDAGPDEQADTEMDWQTDPYLAKYEEKQPLRHLLRERRLALLNPSGDEKDRGLVIASQQCMCSETRTSYDMLLTDPTARHTFALMVNLACSEVELQSDSSSLAVLPTSVSSSIVVDLHVDDAPDLKPLSLRLFLSDCELRRRSAGAPGSPQRDSTVSQRSSASGGASSSLRTSGAWRSLSFSEPPLLRVVGPTTMVMDLTEPADADLADIRSPRWYLDVGGLLQACVSYPLLLDVLELVGQLQLDLLEVTSEEEEILLGRQPSDRESPRRSSVMYMPVSLEDGWEEEVGKTSLCEILQTIQRNSPEAPPSPPTCSSDLRLTAVNAPLTVLVPCARTIDGAEDRVLGATLEGLLVMQLRLKCEPTENPIKDEEGDASEGMLRTHPAKENHAVSSQLISVTDISSWLLPEDNARHLLKTSFADVDLTQHSGRPLLLFCQKLAGRLAQQQEKHFTFNLSEVILHVSISDAVLLSLLLRSLEAGSPGAASEVHDEPQPDSKRTTLEVMVDGISVRLLHASAGRERQASLKVLARLDIGIQELHLVSHEEVELLLYKLQHVLLSDREQEVALVRFFGEQGGPCCKLRLGNSSSAVVAPSTSKEVSILLGHLQLLAHWNLCSSLLVFLAMMKNAVAAKGAQGRNSPAPAPSDQKGGTNSLAVRGRLQQFVFYVPTFGEGLEERGGLLLSCGLQLAGGPVKQKGHWKGRTQVSQLSLMAVDSLEPSAARSGSSAILHPMRLQLTLIVKALNEDDQGRHTDFYGLRVLVEPIRVTLQPNHLKAVNVLQSNVDQLKANLDAAEQAQASRGSVAAKPVSSTSSPWTGHLQVNIPVLRVGAVASPEEPEACILVMEAVKVDALAAIGTAIGVETCSAAEQAAAAAAVAAASAMASRSAKAAAQAATATAAAAAAAAATAQDTEESVAASDFCLQLQARVGAVYADVVSINGPEEHEVPLLEPTAADLLVPAYQGLRTKKRVWLGKELLQAFCPQISITWVNVHASEVNAAVLARLYSCFEVARQYKHKQGGFSLQQGEEDQLEITRERTGKKVVTTLRNSLGSCAVLAVPEKSEKRSSRMIARLVEEGSLPLDVAKRRAQKLHTREYRSRTTKQQRIQKSRSALLDTVAVDRKSPVRSMLPMIARAEDLVLGAGRVAKGAVKDTVKRSNEVFKELRKAAAAEVISREVDEADELERAVTTGLRFGEEGQGHRENLGLGMLPGWPLADLRAALRHRARACTVVSLPLLPPSTWYMGRDSLRDSNLSKRFSRYSKTSELTEDEKSASTEGRKTEAEAGLYDDDNDTDANSEYSRSLSGWSNADNVEEEDEVSEASPSPGSPGDVALGLRTMNSGQSLRASVVTRGSATSMRSSRNSARSQRGSQASRWSYRSPLSSFNLNLFRGSSRSSNWSRGSGSRLGFLTRGSRLGELAPRAKRKLQTMNTAAKDMAGYASEVAGKAVNKMKNFAMQRKLKRGIGMEFTSKVLVRKVALGKKDIEGSCELEMTSTVFLQNRSSVPMVVFPLADDAKSRLLEGEDSVSRDYVVGLLQKCGWLTLEPREAPQAVPLMWCVSERVFRATHEAQQVAEDLLMETDSMGGLSTLLDHDSQVWREDVEPKVADAVQKAAAVAFTESQSQKKPFRPWCCSLSSLEEVGLDTLTDKATDEVLPALKKLLAQGYLQPLLDDGTWASLIGAKKLSNTKEMLGRRLDNNLRGLCSTVNGVGTSRPRSPEDSLFFLVTIEYMVRVCNRLCCTLELTPHEGPEAAAARSGSGSWSLLPGEDSNCRELDQLQVELLLPAEKAPGNRSSLGSIMEEEDLAASLKEVDRYELVSPNQLLENAAAQTSPSSRRRNSYGPVGPGRKGVTCVFKAAGDGKLVEVQVQREEGVIQEHCHWPDLHATQFGSHTCQITLFVSHWLVNRASCSVLIPHPRLVAGLSRSRGAEEPLMVIPGHSLRPLSQHALQDGSLEIGLRAGAETAAGEAGSGRLTRTTTLRTRRNMWTAQKMAKTGNIRVDRPGKGGVLPSLALGDHASSGTLCVGFSVNQAPFPFYRTLVVELTRRYTLVNLKRHRLWVSDGSRALELPPGEPQAYHPNNGDAEFHLDLSGVGPNNFTAGFRLSQLFNVDGSTSGRRGKLQLMYRVKQDEEEDSYHRSSMQSSGSLAFSGQRWGLIAVEALEDSSALILRFSDPVKPQFRMVNRSRGAVAFRQDHASAPFFHLEPEAVLSFAWYSPPSFRSEKVAPENVQSGHPALWLGPAGDAVENEEDLRELPLKRYDIAQVREHAHLEFPQVQPLHKNSRMSQVVSKQLSRMTHRMTTRLLVPPAPPDIYKVRTTVHQGSLEVHIFPWVRISNQTNWPVIVRADSSDDGKLVEAEEWVDLWPRGSNRSEMLFQMKRSGDQSRGYEWSQPLTLSESMTTYRGFFRQRTGGGVFRQRTGAAAAGSEAETVEVAVARDEQSGFLRLTLAECKQEPYLIENKSSEKCRFAPKNATGWVMNLQKGDGECPFFSHLWGGDTWMTMTIDSRGEATDSFDFDLSVPATHHFREVILEVGKAKHQPRKVLVKDATLEQRRLSRRSIRERGVLNTLNRMSVAFHHEHWKPHIEMGVAKVGSLLSNPSGKMKSQVTFAEEPEEQRLYTMTSEDRAQSARSSHSHRNSFESRIQKPARFIEWVTMTSTLSSAMTGLNLRQSRRRSCLCWKSKPPPAPVKRKKAVRFRPARSEVVLGEDAERLDWALDLYVEGLGVAMLDMQLDTRDSHELGYASLKSLTVKLRQVAAKTDVEGRAGALWGEVKLRSLHLDVGTGEAKHQSKACHSVLRPFTGPLQILSQDGEPPPILHLEAMLKLVTENQEGVDKGSKAIDTRDGSAHYEVRRMELKVQPVGIHIETALVSEVVVWVLELCSVLKTGTLRQQNAMQHLAHALDAEEMNGEDAALVDLKYCEPRVVQNPTAEDFRDQTPVVIRELTLRKICCVMTLSFTGTGHSTSERKEELQALEMLLRLTLPLDVHQARMMLGKMKGMSVKDILVRERFLSNGTEELTEILVSQLTKAALAQVPKLFGSQLLIGNPRRLGEELFRAAELGAMGIRRIQPQVVLAAFLLGLAAFTTSLRGMFLIASKEACRISTGQVPDQLLREPARVRQAIAQALYYGLPWHFYRVALRLRNRWKDWSRRCGICEGLRLLLLAIFWIICTPISALLVTATKILQALELLSRRSARFASPTHVTAIGPPTPMRTGSQMFVGGYPRQFSRSAARPLAALKAESAYVARSNWILRELPERGRFPGEDDDDDENLWGWLLLLRGSAQLILVQPPQQLPTLRVELVDPPPEETRRIKGPFTRVELDATENTLMCYLGHSKIEYLHLPCREAAHIAFSLAAENVFRG